MLSVFRKVNMVLKCHKLIQVLWIKLNMPLHFSLSLCFFLIVKTILSLSLFYSQHKGVHSTELWPFDADASNNLWRLLPFSAEYTLSSISQFVAEMNFKDTCIQHVKEIFFIFFLLCLPPASCKQGKMKVGENTVLLKTKKFNKRVRILSE